MKMERLLICGDRDWKNFQFILTKLSEFHQKTPVEVVIEGEANGADMMARFAAERLGIPVLPFKANWGVYERAAGPIRNQKMLKEGKPTRVWAFHNFIENSKGTKHMVGISRKAGIPTEVFTEKELNSGKES